MIPLEITSTIFLLCIRYTTLYPNLRFDFIVRDVPLIGPISPLSSFLSSPSDGEGKQYPSIANHKSSSSQIRRLFPIIL